MELVLTSILHSLVLLAVYDITYWVAVAPGVAVEPDVIEIESGLVAN